MSKKGIDKCSKDMAKQSAICSLMPNTKMIRSCMEGVSKDFIDCHTSGVSSGDQSQFSNNNGGCRSGGWKSGKFGPIQVIKNPDWYPGCQSKCSYYIPEYLYKDHNGNFVESNGHPPHDYSAD